MPHTADSSTPQTYRLTPEIEAQLRRLLTPGRSQDEVVIEIRFGYPLDPEGPAEREPPPAIRPYLRRTIDRSRERLFIAEVPAEPRTVHAAYTAIQTWPIVTLRIDGKPLPYSGNLWLPLIFFHLAEPQQEPPAKG